MKPLVTVLMPVYNAEKYLAEAIESILNQTYKSFDFLIINDGSTDSSLKIIQDYAEKDNRIKIISRENKGLIATLNEGLDTIDTKYIARMDADDISLPKRLEKQVKFMEKNDDIVVCGTGIITFNQDGTIRKHIMPSDEIEIKVSLLSHCVLMHPTVILRKDVLDKERFRYNSKHRNIEDYGLWQLISNKYKLGNLTDILLKYRIVETSITQVAEKDVENRDNSHIDIYKQAFNKLGVQLTEEEYRIYRDFVSLKKALDVSNNEKLDGLIFKISNKLLSKKEIEEFNIYIAKQFLYFLRFSLNDMNKMKMIINKSQTFYKFKMLSKFGIYQKLNNIVLKKLYSMLIKKI